MRSYSDIKKKIRSFEKKIDLAAITLSKTSQIHKYKYVFSYIKFRGIEKSLKVRGWMLGICKEVKGRGIKKEEKVMNTIKAHYINV